MFCFFRKLLLYMILPCLEIPPFPLNLLCSLDGIMETNSIIIRAVAGNEMPPNRANCLGYLLNLHLKALDMKEVLPKIELLEKKLMGIEKIKV